MMGRRAKLLKPCSWGAADICFFSISSSVSLSHQALFPFHGLLLSLSRYTSSVPLLTPSPVLLAVLFLIILFLFHSLHPTSASWSYSSLQRKTSAELQAQYSYAERICKIFSPENLCNCWHLLPPLCDDSLTILCFEKESWSLVKTGERKGYFSNSRGGSFSLTAGEM